MGNARANIGCLRTLELGGPLSDGACRALGEGLAANQGIEKLVLEAFVTDAAGASLAEALGHNTSLRTLVCGRGLSNAARAALDAASKARPRAVELQTSA